MIVVVLIGAGFYFFRSEPQELEPQEFAKALNSGAGSLLIDLRSSADFSKGHIPGATNIDSGRRTYVWRIQELDTTLHLFLYCQDGGRSAKSAADLQARGFASVTILKGGLERWLDAHYALTPEELVPAAELTLEKFSRMLDLEHLVIVDFYLPGDRKCRALEPALDELAMDYHGDIKFLRIDTDLYKQLSVEMGIESVPTLQFYENGNLLESIEGVHGKDYIEKAFRLREYTTIAYQAPATPEAARRKGD